MANRGRPFGIPTPAMADGKLNWNSKQVTQGWQMVMQSFFWRLGFSEEDFDKPQVGMGVPAMRW